jgi:hypothetical protein
MMSASLLMTLAGLALPTATELPAGTAVCADGCGMQHVAIAGRGDRLVSRSALRQQVISKDKLNGAMNAMAAHNPRFITGMHCFADNLTVEQLEYIMANYNARPPAEFAFGNVVPMFNVDNTVWTGNGVQVNQASNPSQYGTRANLTYSFPADGTLWGNPSAAQAANQLSADITGLFGATNLDQGRELIRQGLASWRRNAGLTYTEVADSGVAMDNITSRRSSVGDIRIGSVPQGTTGVLAYNYYPNGGGDMTINSNYFAAATNTFSQSGSTFRYFRNVVAHEHGHGLGLGHQTPCVNTKLMEPFANTAFDMVATDDRRGAQRAYGDRFAGNATGATARNFGDLTSPLLKSVVEKELSTNGQFAASNPSGADWFRFTLSSPQTVSITAAPTGGTYLALNQTSGCNPTTGTNEDASSAGNLALELRNGTNGATVLLTANANTNGGTELISAGTLDAGTYWVRVYDVGPNDSANGIVQLYTLTLRVATETAPPTAIAGVNKRVAANTRAYFYGSLNSYANEGSISSYAWDFTNDGTFEVNGSSVFRTYVTNGTFNATLRVTDSNAKTATDTITVVVTGATSTVSSVIPSNANTGSTVPLVITGTNFRGITAAGVTVPGGGVTITGTPVVDYLGTTITGLSAVIAPGAADGPRDLRVVTTDGAVTLVGGLNIRACPVISGLPASITIEEGQSLSLAATVTGTGPLTYSWLRNSSSITSANAIGVSDSTLQINPAAVSDSGVYNLVVTGPCATLSSADVVVVVTPPVPAACLADVTLDGTVDGSDFIAFINSFGIGDAAVDPVADVAGGGSSALPEGGPDGTIDGTDFIAFINAFAVGC